MKPLFSLLISTLLISCGTAKKADNCKGPAKTDCMCTKQYDPVCGCDGKTYGNACEANCAGIRSTTPGKCK